MPYYSYFEYKSFNFLIKDGHLGSLCRSFVDNYLNPEMIIDQNREVPTVNLTSLYKKRLDLLTSHLHRILGRCHVLGVDMKQLRSLMQVKLCDAFRFARRELKIDNPNPVCFLVRSSFLSHFTIETKKT
jgi:hypothetical protein